MEKGKEGGGEGGEEEKGMGESMWEDWLMDQEQQGGREGRGGEEVFLASTIPAFVPCLDEDVMRGVFQE